MRKELENNSLDDRGGDKEMLTEDEVNLCVIINGNGDPPMDIEIPTDIEGEYAVVNDMVAEEESDSELNDSDAETDFVSEELTERPLYEGSSLSLSASIVLNYAVHFET